MIALVLVLQLLVECAGEHRHHRVSVPLRARTPLVEHRRPLDRRHDLCADLLDIGVEDIKCKRLILQMLLLAEVPDEESDREVALRPVEALDGEDEPTLVGVLEEAVPNPLVIVRIEVLEFREHAEVCVPLRELFADAEEELCEQFTARLAVALLVHPFTDRRLRDGVL